MSSPLPKPGQIVRVRCRNWVVESTDAQDLSPENACIHLSCLDDDAQGTSCSVLWQLERDAMILGEEAWKEIGRKGFDDPRQFGAFMHTLRWNCVTATDPKLFQSPFRAGIRLDAYQLEPLAKALQMPRVNLFIADDVGLGKTIEAGLILSELLLRRRLNEIVVAAPPSMLVQWQEELDSRFGLTFQILDREYVEEVRRTRGFGVNPWTTFPRFLVSHRLLADEAYMAPLRVWLDGFRPSTMLILDEAHHAAPASGAKYAIDSRLTESVRDLAQLFEHRLFLSATPHNGHPHSFSALLEILDPHRFTRGVKVNPSHVKEVMIRRLKDDIREVAGGFPQRVVEQVDLAGLPPETPELRLAELLGRYWDLREKALAQATKRQQTEMGLLLSGLQQRLFSSVEAFSRTLSRHRATMERIWAGEAPGPATGRIDRESLRGGYDSDDERALLTDDEQAQEESEAIEAATSRTAIGESHTEERALLAEMDALAQTARWQADARVTWLVDWIRKNQCPGGVWNDLRLIVFTEYEDTRRYLVGQLEGALANTDLSDERIMVYHGPTPADRREQIKRAFNAPPDSHPVRILVCTDAAREGLNLQAHCWNLVHFDVPWNPARMEQRNGRIDRKLQRNPQVFCRYFMYAQRPEDRILKTLVEKTDTIRKELGSLSKVLENRLAASLEMGIRRGERLARLGERMEAEEQAVREKKLEQAELEEHRQRDAALRKTIDSMQLRLDAARKWIGLDHRHLKDCLDASLSMQGVEPLQSNAEGHWIFPDLDRRYRGDSSWAGTLSTLRERELPTLPSERKPFQKAKESLGALRPVTFDAPETVDDSVVQLHLEHRVVKRLLSRFLSQGFLHHDLSRACLAQTRDSVPRVVLLGRLSVHGAGAARLHEELVPITARWTDPARREGPLKPFAREAEAKTLEQLEEALLPENRGTSLDPDVQRRLHDACAQDVSELLESLDLRAREIQASVVVLLKERAQQETARLRNVLEDQRKRVQAQLDDKNNEQLELSLDDPEQRRTYLNNRRYWKQWLSKVDETLSTEPARIEAFYTPRSYRVEPVGLAYLWPVGA